ncbi:MAG: AhpC/TSA family protein [Alistipes sp.]|nr:AhpC/TSA family protein [Alistipes sp.]
MKQLSICVLAFALLSACTPRNHISGHIEGLTNDTVILRTLTLGDYKSYTDTLIATNGKISYTTPHEQAATYTFMPVQGTHKFEGGTRRFSSCSDINIFRIDGERVTFKARMDSIFVTEFKARGSQINEDWNQIHAHINPLIIKAALLQFENLSYEEFEREHTKINNEIIAYNQEYIRQHPDRLISANLIAGTGSTENMIKYADMISDEVRNSPAFAPTFERIETAKERLRITKAFKEGAMAPDFTLSDINGKPFTLSTTRGKWVVLDFWGSWCVPCIKGMPEMKAAYKKLGNKVEFIGIACNDKQERWQNAVATHALTWPQLFNPRDNDYRQDPLVLYNIKAFPTKIILTPEGAVHKVFVGETPDFYKELDNVVK